MTFCTACESDTCTCTCPKDTLPEPLRQLLLACRVRLVECSADTTELQAFKCRLLARWIDEVLG